MASKSVDLNELYKLPLPAQLGVALGVIALILGLGYFLIFSDQYSSLKAAEAEEITLKEDFEKKARQAAQLPALEKQLEKINESFAILLRQLPTDAEVPNLIQELHDAASANGMRLDTVLPQATVNDDQIDILPYKISLTGNHDQLSRFSRDVGKLSRIITLNDIEFKPVQNKDNTFTLTAVAHTYKAVEASANTESASEVAGSQSQGAANEN